MSEGSATSTMIDAKQFIYLPKGVKLLVTTVALLVLIGAGFGLGDALLFHRHGESIVFFISVAQSAAAILIFFLVVSFSRRDANVDQLHTLTDNFLLEYMRKALSRVSIPAIGIESFSVKDEGQKDIFGRLLKMEHADFSFQLWVGLNVSRLFVIYFVPLRDGFDIEAVKKAFEFTFGGAQKVGFHANFELSSNGDEQFVSIWLTAETQSDLLSSPPDKLFWSQDIAMMTESFLRTAQRRNIDLKLRTIAPGPL